MKKLNLSFWFTIVFFCVCSCDGDAIVPEYDIYGDYNPEAMEQPHETPSYMTRFANTKCINIPVPEDRYQYPIVPGTDEWASAMKEKGVNGIVEDLRIPEDELARMSTGAVIWAYFDYPFISDWIYTNQPRKTAESYTETTPAGPEMMKRADMADYLFDYYMLFDPVGCSLYDRPFISENIELIISFPNVSKKFSVRQAKTLVKTALENIELRKANNRGYENETTCLMIAHLLFSANFSLFRTAVIGDSSIYRWMFGDDSFHALEDYSKVIWYAQMFVD